MYRTPLYVASMNGHIEVVNILISNPKTQLNKSSAQLKTPRDIALEMGHHDIYTLINKAIFMKRIKRFFKRAICC